MKIRVLFYRAERDGHWIDDAISLWTKLWNWRTSPYSHCEVWWPDWDGDFTKGHCFTSTMRGNDNGTVIRPASSVLTHPDRWDYIEMMMDDLKFTEAKNAARLASIANKGYDKLCLLGFFLPWRLRNEKKNICSEAVQKFLKWGGVFPEYKVWSPRRLSAKLINMGYEIQRIT